MDGTDGYFIEGGRGGLGGIGGCEYRKMLRDAPHAPHMMLLHLQRIEAKCYVGLICS